MSSNHQGIVNLIVHVAYTMSLGYAKIIKIYRIELFESWCFFNRNTNRVNLAKFCHDAFVKGVILGVIVRF